MRARGNDTLGIRGNMFPAYTHTLVRPGETAQSIIEVISDDDDQRGNNIYCYIHIYYSS